MWLIQLHGLAHACTHIHTHIYSYTHRHIHRCTHTHAQTHAQMHAQMHAHAHTHTDVCVTVSGVHAYQSTDCVHHCTPRVHLPAQCPDLLHGTLQIWSVHPFSFIYITALPFPTHTHSEASQITPGALGLYMGINTTKLFFYSQQYYRISHWSMCQKSQHFLIVCQFQYIKLFIWKFTGTWYYCLGLGHKYAWTTPRSSPGSRTGVRRQ